MNITDWIATKTLPDGRGLFIYPLTYGRARLGIGPLTSLTFDDEF